MDKIGKECEERGIHLYKYKNLVNVMPLSMVDDLLTITNCGSKSVAANSFVMNKIEMVKLSCGEDKCKQIHIGSQKRGCPVLKVHDKDIKKVCQEKYLDDMKSCYL